MTLRRCVSERKEVEESRENEDERHEVRSKTKFHAKQSKICKYRLHLPHYQRKIDRPL